jgi:hypothetical protein
MGVGRRGAHTRIFRQRRRAHQAPGPSRDRGRITNSRPLAARDASANPRSGCRSGTAANRERERIDGRLVEEIGTRRVRVDRAEWCGAERYRSGQPGQTVNLLAFAYGGSNPPLSTIRSEDWKSSKNHGDTRIRVRSSWAGIAQMARARAFQARGRGFEPRFPLHASKRFRLT